MAPPRCPNGTGSRSSRSSKQLRPHRNWCYHRQPCNRAGASSSWLIGEHHGLGGPGFRRNRALLRNQFLRECEAVILVNAGENPRLRGRRRVSQWNCACSNCRLVRNREFAGTARTQAQVAVSPDGRSWFLLGASPDLRIQIEANPSCSPIRELAVLRSVVWFWPVLNWTMWWACCICASCSRSTCTQPDPSPPFCAIRTACSVC